MAREIYGALTVRKNRLDTNSIAIMDREVRDGVALGVCGLPTVTGEQCDRDALMSSGVDALNGDVVERSRGSKAAGIADEGRESGFAGLQFVDRLDA